MVVVGAKGERGGGVASEGIEGIEGMKPEWRGVAECRLMCPFNGLLAAIDAFSDVSCSGGAVKMGEGGGTESSTSDGGRFFDLVNGASIPLALDFLGEAGAQLVSASSSILRSLSSAGGAVLGVIDDVRGRDGVGGGRKGFEGVVGVDGLVSAKAGE